MRIKLPGPVYKTLPMFAAGAYALTVAADVPVTVKLRDLDTEATIYESATGGTTVPQPLTSDSRGQLDAWIEEGSYDYDIAGDDPHVQPIEAVSGAAPGGRELAYVESLVAYTIPASESDIPGMSIAFTLTGDRPFWVEGTIPYAQMDATGYIRMQLFEVASGLEVQRDVRSISTVNGFTGMRVRRRFPGVPGDYAYKLQIYRSAGTTGTVFASNPSGSYGYGLTLQAVEC